jgi:hypothetical protein
LEWAMKKFLFEVFAFLAATSFGLGTFFIVLVTPVYFKGPEILLAWLFYFWIIGIPAGIWIGKFVYKTLLSKFTMNTDFNTK